MKALILAAGRGSRLLSLSRHHPKCLLEVGGHAILDYQIAALRRCGIRDIVIVVGYLANRIKDHVTVPATFVENRDYASTGSSYSLWLAMELVRDGFIYLNSDLIFDPLLLRQLLDDPEPNAVIVDRHVNIAGDMLKAEMDGRRILSTGKRLAVPAAAEVVGPAKIGPAAARRVEECLDRLVGAGDRNRWVYEVLGLVAPDIGLAGVDNPGGFWAEIDTPADAWDANQRIPPSLVRMADMEGRAGAQRPRLLAVGSRSGHLLD